MEFCRLCPKLTEIRLVDLNTPLDHVGVREALMLLPGIKLYPCLFFCCLRNYKNINTLILILLKLDLQKFYFSTPGTYEQANDAVFRAAADVQCGQLRVLGVPSTKCMSLNSWVSP